MPRSAVTTLDLSCVTRLRTLSMYCASLRSIIFFVASNLKQEDFILRISAGLELRFEIVGSRAEIPNDAVVNHAALFIEINHCQKVVLVSVHCYQHVLFGGNVIQMPLKGIERDQRID